MCVISNAWVLRKDLQYVNDNYDRTGHVSDQPFGASCRLTRCAKAIA